MVNIHNIRVKLIIWILVIGVLTGITVQIFITAERERYHKILQESNEYVVEIVPKELESKGDIYFIMLNRLNKVTQELNDIYDRRNPITVASKINIVEQELTIWEKEVEDIIVLLSNQMEESDIEKLQNSQIEWTKSRDTEAAKEADLESDSEQKSLTHLHFKVKITRQRAYELLNDYKDVLEK